MFPSRPNRHRRFAARAGGGQHTLGQEGTPTERWRRHRKKAQTKPQTFANETSNVCPQEEEQESKKRRRPIAPDFQPDEEGRRLALEVLHTDEEVEAERMVQIGYWTDRYRSDPSDRL